MMKKLLMSIGVLALSASVIAGGDDRDRGPVESLDAIASPTQTTGNKATSNKATSNKATSNKATGNQEQKLSVGGKTVSVRAHIACQDKIGLSESNISIFRKAKSGGYLYNTGPVESFGTVFSPKRWDAYLACVDAHGG
ncbi:hypothetical protein BSPLISOX_619 [uncultured Gammaproteobacteria bacterium]|nr:hypothetical protein BSPLISOX_619 [uncultured Gammaproteobacteria bacterium]